MQKAKRLVEELEELAKARDSVCRIENQATHALHSIIHVLKECETRFSQDELRILENKMLLAIKSREQDKFLTSLKKLHATKRKNK